VSDVPSYTAAALASQSHCVVIRSCDLPAVCTAVVSVAHSVHQGCTHLAACWTCCRWDWDGLRRDISTYGVRNSLLVAPMPTASTSQILGNNE
jgi:hypothetical protein